MKNEILDAPFEDTLDFSLEKGEKILWEGSPTLPTEHNLSRNDAKVSSWIGRMARYLISGLLFLIASIFFGGIIMKIFLAVGIVVAFLPDILRGMQRKKTKYIISNRRIIFQLWKLGTLKYYSIPFTEIKNAIVALETQRDGVIFLAVNNPNRISFDTYNLHSGERRHQPTLEMIHDVKDIAKIIQKGIQGKL